MTRRFAFLLLAATAVVHPAPAAELSSEEGYGLVRQMLSPRKEIRREAAAALVASGDRSLVPALVDAIFFIPRTDRSEVYEALSGLTGESLDGYYDWVEYVGANAEPRPKPGYANFKIAAFAEIDPRYREIFYSGATVRIRLEEIVSGGVRVAGIPALDAPPTVSPRKARYLSADELVFGVEVGGEARAYPVRFLSWHEMANDSLGGQPITLSFCTLCGTGIVYSGRLEGGRDLTFDTSGLLYRSNKLMVDRETKSLWSNVTGLPVVGELAAAGTRLEVLPSTLSTWSAWRKRHPDTTVLDLEGVRAAVDPRFGFDYTPGAADTARRGVAFPVWLKDGRLDRNTEVFTLRRGSAAKAYPLERLWEERVVNDVLAGESLVIIADAASQSIRAYSSFGNLFDRVDGEVVVDSTGGRWRVAEASLEAVDGKASPASLERLPGHVAFWFGWYAFYPKTELYQ